MTPCGCEALAWMRVRGAPSRLAAAWVAVLLLIALLAAPASALRAAGQTVGAGDPDPTGAPPLRDYVVDRWTSRQGLPHNSIRDVAQTPDGYLWLATWEGLVRYDGLDFTVYSRATSEPALPDNGVGALYVDPAGALWMSDSRGNLGRRTPDGQWRFWIGVDEGWPQALIHAMAMDADGRLWLLFEGHGLGRLDGDGDFEYVAPPDDVPLRASFSRMAVDDAGRIWIGGMDGLMVRDPSGSVRRAPASFGMGSGLAWPYRAPDGAIWLVAGDGVHRLDGDTPRQVHRVSGQGVLTSMLQDHHGDLWIGSESRGLLRLSRHGVEAPPSESTQPPGRIVALLEDAEGSLWVGANGGLFRFRETLFTRWTRRDGLSGDYVRAVLEDRDGALWIGGAGGLDRMARDGRIAPVALEDGVPPSVLSLALDDAGDLWVGTYGGRVYRLRGDRVVQRFEAADGLLPGHARALAVDGTGGVWAATQHGPVRIAEGRVSRPRAEGMPSGLVTALAWIDGALWIGSVEGASVLRAGLVRRIALERLSGARSVFGFQSVGGDVWISTDRGLYRDRDGTLARVGLEQGLPVDTVFQLVPDRLGNGWITTNRGVLRARMDDLDAVADGRLERLPLERYDETDGMANAQGNGSSGPSAILRADGSVWVTTAGGLSVVDPRRWQGFSERPSPRPAIESVRVDGLDRHWHDGDRLPGGARISVSYVGLSFLIPERIRYRTRLDGLDARWMEHDRQRRVEFVGLPPGDYTLRIAAAHPEGEWSADEASWQFSVAPLWWQRAEVRTLAVVALLLTLFGLYRMKMRRYEAANARLVRLVDDRTSALKTQTDQLLLADSEKNELLQQLRAQSDTFERQAYEDALTALPNRRSFDEALQREFALARRRPQPLCVLVLDVDHFKSINDRHTHAGGDAVLREIGALLATTTRASDVAARVGGEEFGIVLVDATRDDAIALFDRLRERLAARADWGGVDGLQVTISAGTAVLEPDDTSPSPMLRRADEALYRAKRDGRDRIHVG